MDVALPRHTKEMRMRPLVQISREGTNLKAEHSSFIRSHSFCASLSHLKIDENYYSFRVN